MGLTELDCKQIDAFFTKMNHAINYGRQTQRPKITEPLPALAYLSSHNQACSQA